jgi:hypothetical protein
MTTFDSNRLPGSPRQARRRADPAAAFSRYPERVRGYSSAAHLTSRFLERALAARMGMLLRG